MAEERTDGMIALIPADPAALAVAGGDPVDELHLTVAYLGDGVALSPQAERDAVHRAVAAQAATLAPIAARVFGHAVFNPDGHGGREPCAVYLVGDTRDLAPLREEMGVHASAEQIEPFVPHVTAGYNIPLTRLKYTGAVLFDHIRVAIGGTSTDYPLTGTSTKGSTVDDPETKRHFSQAERDKLSKTPKAMDDGSYPIENIGDLRNAIKAYGRADESKREKLRAHIVRNAKRLNAVNMLPKNWSETPKSEKKGTYTWADAPDPFTAGVLLGLAGLDEDEREEIKAGPPGATYPSPDPGATKLREYWVRGPGARKIRWGTGGDFDRCVRHMRKHVGTRAEGLCNIYHRSALGAAPGQGHKSAGASAETKTLELWVADPDSPVGWRAQSFTWRHVSDSGLAAELKQAADIERAQIQAARRAGGLEAKNRSATLTAPPDEEDVTTDPEAALDRFEEMADTLTAEEAYEEALSEDLEWEMTGDGELVEQPAPAADGSRPAKLDATTETAEVEPDDEEPDDGEPDDGEPDAEDEEPPMVSLFEDDETDPRN